jgi:hypothetical protein
MLILSESSKRTAIRTMEILVKASKNLSFKYATILYYPQKWNEERALRTIEILVSPRKTHLLSKLVWSDMSR